MDRFGPARKGSKVQKENGPPFEVDHGRDPFDQNSDRSGRKKKDHLKRWTRFFETFPVGPNRSIEFWTEISGKFG